MMNSQTRAPQNDNGSLRDGWICPLLAVRKTSHGISWILQYDGISIYLKDIVGLPPRDDLTQGLRTDIAENSDVSQFSVCSEKCMNAEMAGFKFMVF
jgi:hypothetical protein